MRRRCMAYALAAALVVLALAGCKQAEQPEQAQPTATVAPSGQKGDNPLSKALVALLEQKDLALGQLGMKLETYTPQEGQPDYTNLMVSVQSPFTEVDALLADVVLDAYELQPQADGSYAVSDAERTASLVLKDGVYQYTCSEPVTDEAGGEGADGAQPQTTDGLDNRKQSVQMQPDASAMTIYLYDHTENASSDVMTLWMQTRTTAQGFVAQCYFTRNNGDTYDLLCYEVAGQDTLRYAIYDDVEEPADLSTQSVEPYAFPSGAQTTVTYQGGAATIVNEKHTITL